MTITRNKIITETVVYRLKDTPEDGYNFLGDDAVATIVNGEVDEVRIHVGNENTCATDTDCIEWLTALAGLANGLLEELSEKCVLEEDPDMTEAAHWERMKKPVREM